MNEAKARGILGITVQPDNSLHSTLHYIHWIGEGDVTLDCEFNAEELEAIAWWIRNMKVTEVGK